MRQQRRLHRWQCVCGCATPTYILWALLPLRALRRRPAEAVLRNGDCAGDGVCATAQCSSVQPVHRHLLWACEYGAVLYGGDANCPYPTPLIGVCSLREYDFCESDETCQSQGVGSCDLDATPCFEHTIARVGTPATLDGHCVDEPSVPTCTTNADCSVGACIEDTATPTLVSLFCSADPGAGTGLRNAIGLPGPGTLTLRTVAHYCRCGDGNLGCGEQCDDGNLTNGDGCDQACRQE